MAVSTQDRRRAAQSTHWAPLHPVADNRSLNGSDRRIVLGVYPGPSLYVSGLVSGVSDTQGALGFLIPLASSVSAASSTTASLSIATQLDGSVSATSSVTASLLVAAQLAGFASAASGTVASLFVATPLAGSVSATSSADGNLSFAVLALIASVTASSSTTGYLTGGKTSISAVVIAVSSTTGQLSVARRTIGFYERTANQITSYFQGIANTNSFVVRFDNDPRVTPTEDVWYLASVDFGVANQHELGTTTSFRVVGNFSIRSQDAIGTGMGVLLENSDTITTAFRNTDVGRITFNVPRINNTGRIGDNFQINITCPFMVDKQPT